MTELMSRAGFRAVEEERGADVIIVNTCGFIAAAREESYRTLRELAARKCKGQLLIAAGCLTQRYGEEVCRQAPGVDGILGTRRWMDIVDLVKRLRKDTHPLPVYHLPDAPTMGSDERETLRASVMGSSAYLKLADGCRRPCAFCAIPLIKGTLVSRPVEAILRDAVALQDQGVQELILLAQDTTDYGSDLGLKDGLTHLLKELLPAIPEIPWVRLMYAYPGSLSDALIEQMATQAQILHYLDIPLQHAHPDVLRRMKRPANMDWVYQTLEKMRRAMPDLALRTTFIVGYPGETDAEFDALLDFLCEIRFDKVGAFQYSFEQGTPAEALGDSVPAEVKQARWETLMETQQQISLEKNMALVGQNLDVIVDGLGEVEDSDELLLVGRSYRDAPEIDGLVLVENAPQDAGGILPVSITGAMAYDLVGVIAQQS